MVILGLALIILGGIAILSAVFVSEAGTGGDADLWGFSILKWGTKRSLAHRRERKELTELNQKLERVEAERRDDDPERRDTV